MHATMSGKTMIGKLLLTGALFALSSAATSEAERLSDTLAGLGPTN
jgi:hypothetical protein